MNRYVIEGILRDLEQRKRIALVGVTLEEVDDALHAVEYLGGPDAWEKIVRAYGRRSLHHRSGGRILGASIRGGHSNLRGFTADVVVLALLRGVPEEELDRVRSDIAPLVAHGGEVILTD